jgi:drug/metabolite transporter (DMT)-like permease
MSGRQLLGIIGLSICLILGPASASFSYAGSTTNDYVEYDRRSVVIIIEVAKLAVSCCFLLAEATARKNQPGQRNMPSQIAPFEASVAARFAVPSIIYTITNNIMLYAMLLVPLNVVYVLLQSKILFTAVLRWLVLGVSVSRRKAVFITIIALACAIVVVPATEVNRDIIGSERSSNTHEPANNTEVSGMPPSDTLFGILLLLAVCALSTLASVYSELLLCSTPGSIHWQNIQLYTIGLVFNFTVSLAHGPLSLRGINGWVLLYIVGVVFFFFFFFFFFFQATRLHHPKPTTCFHPLR